MNIKVIILDLIIAELLVIFTLPFVSSDVPANRAELFGKDQRMEKLTLSNQIGYHFKKVVREVSQELFVSRKIDVTALFQGIQVLKQTQEGLFKYCKSLSAAPVEGSISTPQKKAKYILLLDPNYASFSEARARCEALNLQLPELYTPIQIEELSNFLRTNGLLRVFAGITPEPVDAIHRFISTGYPIWKTPHDKLIDVNYKNISFMLILDDLNAKFLYTVNSELMIYWENPNIQWDSKFGDPKFREKVTQLTQAVAPIVCEHKWDGKGYENFKPERGERLVPELKVKLTHLNKRSVNPKSNQTNSAVTDWLGLKSLKELCLSVAEQAGEIQNDMFSKLTNVLSLVDISVHLEKSDTHRERMARSIFLAKFIFVTGVRLIWKLYGFIQQMRMNAQLDRIENTLAVTKAQVDANSRNINNMSLMISNHAVAINSLKITTTDLDRRLTIVERKVTWLENTMDNVINQLESFISIQLIADLINRIQQSLNTGYDILKDIIHCSLLGQTSPLLLPVDQLQLVQNEVRRVSTGVLDTDFSRMQSIVVSDPHDPHLLLVVINVASLDRKNMHLIKLVPIPYFEGNQAFAPILDYDTVVLDHAAPTYSILTEQEEHDCLFGRCYISDVQRSVSERTCGIPQYLGQHLDACLAEEVLSSGVFVKPMLPDGVLFALREPANTQLLCKDNTEVGQIRRLNGTGIMQLPNGCILSITDKYSRVTKVKGQPLYRMIDAEEITFSLNGPLSSLQAINSRNITQRIVYGQLTEHLSSVVKQVETVDLQLSNQRTSIWVLIGIFIALVMIVSAIVMVAYKHRGKFLHKIFDLRGKLTELNKIFTDFKRTFRGPSPPLTPRAHFDHLMLKNKGNIYGSSHKDERSSRLSDAYISMNDVAAAKREELDSLAGFRPLDPITGSSPSRQYPRLTPLFRELHRTEFQKESEEVEKLCTKSPSSL